MSIIIGINSIEKNIGVTSLSLFLGQALYEVTRKSIMVVDLDTLYPEMKSALEQQENINNYCIDNIMTYATMETAKLESVIKSNSTSLINSKLNVIYGTNFKDKKYTNIQMANLLQALREQYDFVILDLGQSETTNTLLNNIDMFLTICIPSERYLRGLASRRDLLTKKTEFVLNMDNSNININKSVKNLLPKPIYFKFPFSKEVQMNLNKGYIDFNSGIYQTSLYDLAEMILKKFSLNKMVSANFMFSNDIVKKMASSKMAQKITKKISGKKEIIKTEPERVKTENNVPKVPLLGQILVEKGYISKEQLKEALELQS